MGACMYEGYSNYVRVLWPGEGRLGGRVLQVGRREDDMGGRGEVYWCTNHLLHIIFIGHEPESLRQTYMRNLLLMMSSHLCTFSLLSS